MTAMKAPRRRAERRALPSASLPNQPRPGYFGRREFPQAGCVREPDKGLKGWMVRYARANMWRVPAYYTLEDLIQDGYVQFYRCCHRYGATEPRHFMALFKRCYSNHITDLANERTATKAETSLSDLGVVDDTAFYERAAGQDDLSAIATLLVGAPKEVVDVLRMFTTDAARALREPYDQGGRRKRGQVHARETTNERWCRLLGYDPNEVDLPDLVRSFLTAQ